MKDKKLAEGLGAWKGHSRAKSALNVVDSTLAQGSDFDWLAASGSDFIRRRVEAKRAGLPMPDDIPCPYPEHKTDYTPGEDEFLREHYRELGREKCAAHLGRTVDSVQKRAVYLKITRQNKKEAKKNG